MVDLDAIPAFLRITPERRKLAWIGVPLTIQGHDGKPVEKLNHRRPKTWSAEAEALEAALFKQEHAKTMERIETMKAKLKA